MQVIYRGTPLPKCDFNKVSKQLNCKITFSVKLQSPIERIHLFACNILKECFIFSYSTQMLHGKTRNAAFRSNHPEVFLALQRY